MMVIAITIFYIHAYSGTIFRMEQDFHTLAIDLTVVEIVVMVWEMISLNDLQFAKGMDEVVSERRGVRWVLPNLLPANRRRTRWGDKEVFLELRRTEMVPLWVYCDGCVVPTKYS